MVALLTFAGTSIYIFFSGFLSVFLLDMSGGKQSIFLFVLKIIEFIGIALILNVVTVWGIIPCFILSAIHIVVNGWGFYEITTWGEFFPGMILIFDFLAIHYLAYTYFL